MKEILNHYSSMHFLFQIYNFFTRQICSVTPVWATLREKVALNCYWNLQKTKDWGRCHRKSSLHDIVPSPSYYKFYLLCRIRYLLLYQRKAKLSCFDGKYMKNEKNSWNVKSQFLFLLTLKEKFQFPVKTNKFQQVSNKKF